MLELVLANIYRQVQIHPRSDGGAIVELKSIGGTTLYLLGVTAAGDLVPDQQVVTYKITEPDGSWRIERDFAPAPVPNELVPLLKQEEEA